MTRFSKIMKKKVFPSGKKKKKNHWGPIAKNLQALPWNVKFNIFIKALKSYHLFQETVEEEKRRQGLWVYLHLLRMMFVLHIYNILVNFCIG